LNEIYLSNKFQLDDKPSKECENLLSELNVKKQVRNIAATNIVKKAWDNGVNIVIHGLIYDLETGLIKDLN
ncbi:15899_t:CDS:1, partial [Racocetra fulgida]